MNTLKNTREFQRVVERGERKTLNTVTVYMLPTRSEETRIGISISKRIGNSVKRNKLKRRVREAIKENAPLLPAGMDIVIVARRGPSEASFQEIEEDIKQLRDDG
jgi:ribonuclease P protein component